MPDVARRRPRTTQARHAHAAIPEDPLDLEDAVTAIELEAEDVMRREDIDAGLIPPDARRSLHPHELAARISYAAIDDAIDGTSAGIRRRLLEDRQRMVRLVADDLRSRRTGQAVVARLLDLDGPTGLAAVHGASEVLDAATGDIRRLLDQAAAGGASRALQEAALQGVPGLPRFAPLTPSASGQLDQLARRAAVSPHADLIRALRERAVAAPTPANPGDLVDDLERHAATLSEGPLDGYAKTAAAGADGLGRQAAALAATPPARIYAGELLDRATCGPCSLIDGHEYPNLEAAIADYPTGTYHLCEGGVRCRGTLVFVWSDETPATLAVPGDRPEPGAGGPGGPPLPGTPFEPPPLPPTPPAGIELAAMPAPPTPDVALERAAAQEAERAARLQSRRDRAAADRETERAALAELVAEGHAAEDVAAARTDLDYWRARARDEARRLAEATAAQLEAATGNTGVRLANPPVRRRVTDPNTGRIVSRRYNADGTPYVGGEWDWLEQISDAEDKRLRRYWFAPRSGGGLQPDQLAEFMRQAGGVAADATDGEALARWLDLNRRVDGYNALAAGKAPSQYAYGGNVTFELPDSPYGALTGDTIEAVRTVLARYAEEADVFADRAAVDAVAGPLVGPRPWELSEDRFVAELTDLEAAYAAADLTPIVDIDPALGRARYQPAVEQLLERYAELVPDAFTSLDLAPRDLYRSILAWAKEAGLHVERFSA